MCLYISPKLENRPTGGLLSPLPSANEKSKATFVACSAASSERNHCRVLSPPRVPTISNAAVVFLRDSRNNSFLFLSHGLDRPLSTPDTIAKLVVSSSQQCHNINQSPNELTSKVHEISVWGRFFNPSTLLTGIVC